MHELTFGNGGSGVGLAIPTVFRLGLGSSDGTVAHELDAKVESISRIISILLIISYGVFTFFQTRTHHGIYNDVFEEDGNGEGHDNCTPTRARLTLTECLIALAVSITLVTVIAITLVTQIEPVIEHSSVSDPFMGLILVPLVEKFAEHLTAIDEAWDNRINFALSHVLGATLQTAFFNAPLTVLIGWALRKKMDLDFELFNLVMLVLATLAVGRFLQDQKSNYLEGFLLVILYLAIAVSAYHSPNPDLGKTKGSDPAQDNGGNHS